MTIQWLSSKRVEGDDIDKDSIPVNALESGYSFTALDTPQEYIWNGVDTWVPIGGGSGGFSPSDLVNLFAWYDASDGSSITAIANRVSQVADKSFNARHLVQATGTAQPLYQLANQNGLNTLNFDSLARFMKSNFGSQAQPLTVFLALKLPANGAGTKAMFDAFSGQAFTFYLPVTTDEWTQQVSVVLNFIEGGFADTWVYVTLIYNTTTSIMRFNGTQKATGNVGTEALNGLTVGDNRTATAPAIFTLGEMVIQTQVASAEDITNMEAYFSSKWGIV